MCRRLGGAATLKDADGVGVAGDVRAEKGRTGNSHSDFHHPVGNIDRLAGAAFVVSADAISPYAEPGSTARLAGWAESAADNLSKDRPLPASPVPTASAPATAMQSDARRAQHAIEQLESEVRHVASAVH